MAYPPLLPWYDRNRRSLPFRGVSDPYAIWVSEIMLQQTRTETVGRYYTRFLERFPSIQALAEAEEQDVLKCWEGLGYYSRARNLRRAAQIVMRQYGGIFPHTYEAVRGLPGIGDYTAAAICSIAFALPYPAIDGNLTRVLSRIHGIREDVGIPSVQRQIAALAADHIDRSRPGDWNQALMDIGASICLPGTPDCSVCPLTEICDAYLQGDADMLPVRSAAAPPKPVNVGVGLVTCGKRILLIRREAALLRGLWVFVLNEGNNTAEGMEKALRGMKLKAEYSGDFGEAKHIFTHRIWNMRLYHFSVSEMPSVRNGLWTDAKTLASLPLPTAMKKARQEAVKLL